MHLFLTILTFIAEWILYAFPLYQGIMELYDEEEAVKAIAHHIDKEKKVPNIFWLFPPLKVYLERRRLLKVIRKSIKKTNNIHAILGFYNKAVAWFMVSLAGLFKSVEATYSLYDTVSYKKSTVFFLVMLGSCFILSTFYIVYRVKKNYRIEQTINNNIDNINKKNKIIDYFIK